MKKILWIISLLFLGFSSCKKNEKQRAPFEGTFELSGIVRDELTDKPIAHADVKIIERERGLMVAWGGKLVGYQRANEKGEYNISFPANESEFSYELVATELNKYFENNSPPRVSFTQSGKGRQDITLMPIGYLTFNIKGNKGGHSLGGGGGSLGVHYKGCDTSVTIHITPNKTHPYTYSVRDINLEIIEKKTIEIFIPLPPDTAFYLIEF